MACSQRHSGGVTVQGWLGGSHEESESIRGPRGSARAQAPRTTRDKPLLVIISRRLLCRRLVGRRIRRSVGRRMLCRRSGRHRSRRSAGRPMLCRRSVSRWVLCRRSEGRWMTSIDIANKHIDIGRLTHNVVDWHKRIGWRRCLNTKLAVEGI